MSEARARADGVVDASSIQERERIARILYRAARTFWLAHRVRHDE
ncbi:MAG TPA: hypothetical protein RMH99_32915 [Sandaracinaceae bacterium LLY-WYZ-13_1]|nr:hypothetical protein [Sandaracinaceae bacterium LLY-WYZ-13_1]